MIQRLAAVWLLACLASLSGCAGRASPADSAVTDVPAAGARPGTGGGMKIASSAFGDGEMIPKKYTCDAQNVSPPVAWSAVPAGAKSLVLIVDDPDAPAGTWVHWVVFNLPPDASGLPEAVPAGKRLANGALQGTTSFRQTGYGGPCPPSGTHRYYFKLYALDAPLTLGNSATAKEVEAALQRHVLAEAQFVGRYKRQ